MFSQEPGRLVFRFDAELLWVEAWGPNALRVRATKMSAMPTDDWALFPLDTIAGATAAKESANITISKDANLATIINGGIEATITRRGKLTVRNSSNDKTLLEEYVRNRQDPLDPHCSALDVEAREFKPIQGTDDYHLTARFESLDANEKIFGMGQYQQPQLDLKGHDLELAHRNSQASVPFAVSSLGYGFLWNNPGIGRAVLGKNIMSFEAYATTALDYWIVAAPTDSATNVASPAALVEAYANVTGKVPMMPEYGLGFWQCKLRYETQEELLEVAREYKRRDLPIDVIVVDFFHWPKQGDWRFDPEFFPDPAAMVAELKSLGIELMVSIWPTVDNRSENYAELLEKGYLIRTDRGMRTAMDFEGNTVHFDATNPGAREYVWKKAKANYYDHGIRIFWLDEAEPEYKVYDFDNYRYFRGPNLRVGNLYPRDYAQAFFDGMTAEKEAAKAEGGDDSNQGGIVNLLRCAWAGSQRYGALVWSGDIASSWGSFHNQLAAGLNMGMAGLPWWTTDIGGFHGGDPRDPAFRELFVRWFQWGAFCPVMRLHGDREPHRVPNKDTKGGQMGIVSAASGGPNEVWSYGPDVYEICVVYMRLRETLRSYTRSLMTAAHEKGSPIMRPLFYDFPHDKTSWNVEKQYMFGPKYLCCPVLAPGQRKLSAYLPPLSSGQSWKVVGGPADGKVHEGGETVEVEAPLEWMPVFERNNTQ